MKRKYEAPKAELLAFEMKDVITTSGFIFDWELPSIDLGDGNGDWEWSEDGAILKI